MIRRQGLLRQITLKDGTGGAKKKKGLACGGRDLAENSRRTAAAAGTRIVVQKYANARRVAMITFGKTLCARWMGGSNPRPRDFSVGLKGARPLDGAEFLREDDDDLPPLRRPTTAAQFNRLNRVTVARSNQLS